MLPLLFATSWYLWTQRDTRYNDVLTRLQSQHQMTCEVLQALSRKQRKQQYGHAARLQLPKLADQIK